MLQYEKRRIRGRFITATSQTHCGLEFEGNVRDIEAVRLMRKELLRLRAEGALSLLNDGLGRLVDDMLEVGVKAEQEGLLCFGDRVVFFLELARATAREKLANSRQ